MTSPESWYNFSLAYQIHVILPWCFLLLCVTSISYTSQEIVHDQPGWGWMRSSGTPLLSPVGLSLSAREGLWGTREGKRQPSFYPVHFPHWLTQNFYQPSEDKNRTVSHNRRSRRNGLGKRIFSLPLSTKFQVSILVVPASSRHRWSHGVQCHEDSWGPQSVLHLLTQWLWNSLKF